MKTTPSQPDSSACADTPGSSLFHRNHDVWLDACVTLRSELKFDTRCEGQNSFVVIEDPVRSKFFQVGPREYRFLASLDGQKTPRETMQSVNQELCPGEIPYDEQTVTRICLWLVQSNLVFGEAIDNAKRLSAQASELNRAELINAINPISFRFKLFNPDRLLALIQPYTQWLFSLGFLILWCAVALYSLVQIHVCWDRLEAASIGILSGYSWIWMLAIWFGLKCIHEAAHGIACRRYGGEVPETGILLLLFTPIAFVNVTSMWRFPNRWHRIVVVAAGMYIELFISFLALILWTRTTGVIANLAFHVFLMSSLTTLLFNANPLMRFDGYFLLSDLIKIPNLYNKGAKWTSDHLKRLLLGVPVTPHICPASERRAVAIYGCLAFAWRILISISLIIGASVLFHGLGLILAGAGVLLWFGRPIYMHFKPLFGRASDTSMRRSRVALSAFTLSLCAISLFWILKAPATQSAPAIVQFRDSEILRSQANGFIRELRVDDGDAVSKGQCLLRLENPVLANEVKALERLAEESMIQYRINKMQNRTALAQAELKNHEELKTQLAEKREEAAALIVTAPKDGFVFQRNLSHRLGSFVRRGDPILSIAQQQSKEIIVSIDQSDFESIKTNQGMRVRVAMPGVPLIESNLTRVDPRASEKPTHLALCASSGGPLNVRPTTEESDNASVKLLAPRFNATLSLEARTGNQLASGQRGRAFFSTRDQSLGNYCYVAVKNWMEKKIEFATQTAPF